MVSLTIKIFICSEPIDMRRSFNSLTGIVQNSLNLEPLSGSLFVFKNKLSDKIKILYFDNDGFAIWYKQLVQGSYKFPAIIDPNVNSLEVDISTLRSILDGFDLVTIRKRKRLKLEDN